MTEKEMWNLYTKNSHVKNKTYDAWCFGGNIYMANKLAKLVVNGIKTATSSAYQLYEIENSLLPPIGGLNIILDSDNNAVCITETTKVSLVHLITYQKAMHLRRYKEIYH